jgi:hypothetical protein
MQFADARDLMRMPAYTLRSGMNLTASARLFDLISGCSICFYNSTPQKLSKIGISAAGRFRIALRGTTNPNGPTMTSAIARTICIRMSAPKMSLLTTCTRLLRRSMYSSVLSLPSHVLQEGRRRRAGLQMTFLGTGFGDRFKVFRGGSGHFEEGVRRAEELVVMQGNRTSKRRSLAV